MGTRHAAPDDAPIASEGEGVVRGMAAIVALLEDRAIAYRLHTHVEVGTIEQARALVPHLTVDLIKTIVFEIVASPRIILVAVDSAAEVDYKRVAQAVGCSRRALRLMPRERIEIALGVEAGGVGPFRCVPCAEIVFDEGFACEQQVKVGAGTRRNTLELAFADLLQLSGGIIAPVSKDRG